MNTKQITLSVFAIVVAWFFADWILHGVILESVYKLTASTWRPLEEMSHTSGVLASIVHAAFFVITFHYFVSKKSLTHAVLFGVAIGGAVGFTMASFYLYLPIPISLAMGWFVGTLLEYALAGAIVGYLNRAQG